MNPEIEKLVNEMMVKSRLYIKTINVRDEALRVACSSESTEDDVKWTAASEAAGSAHDEYYAAIKQLRAAREKR